MKNWAVFMFAVSLSLCLLFRPGQTFECKSVLTLIHHNYWWYPLLKGTIYFLSRDRRQDSKYVFRLIFALRRNDNLILSTQTARYELLQSKAFTEYTIYVRNTQEIPTGRSQIPKVFSILWFRTPTSTFKNVNHTNQINKLFILLCFTEKYIL